jgi:hypothetical protein
MQGGCDKGFCLHYAKLSYRRKFIRTLWIIPAIAGAVAAAGVYCHWRMALGGAVGVIVGGVIQAVRNYQKWQTEEQQKLLLTQAEESRNILFPEAEPQTQTETADLSTLKFPTWSALILIPLVIFAVLFREIRQSENPMSLGLIILGVSLPCALVGWGMLIVLEKIRKGS